jgi:tetratricopeptide (TPR) repeat protein
MEHSEDLGQDDTLQGTPPRSPEDAIDGAGEAGGLVTALQRATLRSRMFATPPSVFVGRYVVLRHLGRGGMGDVFVAYDPQLDRKVALKVLRSRDATDEEGHARMLREAQAMARLTHPNVVTVHDVGVDHGQVFVAMELVDGVTMRAWLEDPPTWRSALEVMLSVGRGVVAAHAVGLVHRDLKPDNVMVGNDGRVRVMDFGLARSLESASTSSGDDARELGSTPDVGALSLHLTRTGAVMGTPAYMAPEQLDGRPTDERTDQFSFCVVLWEAVLRERPFQGDTFEALADAIRGGRPRRPDRDPGVPRWLFAVLERGLAVDPARRFPSMAALLATLEAGHARTRRRRLGAVGLAVLALGAGGLGLDTLERRRSIARCDDEAAAISEVWNDTASERLREGLVATGVEHAADTHARAVPWIDRFTEDWARARREACIAATVEESTQPEPYERARECFEARRDALAAAIEVFSTADAETVSRTVPAFAGLAGVEPACTDPTALSRRRPLMSGAEPVRLRRELARGESLGLAGRYAEAMQTSREVAEAAELQGDDELAASAWTTAGRNAEKGGDLDASEHALQRALTLSGPLQLDTVAADAATAMVYTVGVERDRHDAGLAWAAAAEIFVARIGEEDEMRGAALAGQLGAVQFRRGDYAAAIELHERALAIKERLFGANHPAVGVTLVNLANAENSRGDSARTEQLYRRALAIFESELGPQHPSVASCANNLGSVTSDRGRYREAIAFYERALQIRVASFGEGHISTASTIHNLGNAYLQLGELEDALRLHERALEIRRASTSPDHPDIALALASIAKVERSMGRLDSARTHDEEALAIRERALGPEHPDVVDSLLSLGRLHRNLADEVRAEAMFSRALAIAEKAYGSDHQEIATALMGLGEIAADRGDLDVAIPHLERALAIRERGATAPEYRGLARFALARSLWDAGKERPRALALARLAREDLRANAGAEKERLQQLEAWLESHDTP